MAPISLLRELMHSSLQDVIAAGGVEALGRVVGWGMGLQVAVGRRAQKQERGGTLRIQRYKADLACKVLRC
jgi:hypothetical protein